MSQADHTELYELLIQELEDLAVFLVSPDGRIISWNPGVLRFFGYPEEKFIGLDLAEIFTPEDRAVNAPQREMETARVKGRSSDVRWHVCLDRSRVFVEGALLKLEGAGGELIGFAKMARAVRPTHAAGTMIAALIEGTIDPIFSVDKDGRFVFANAQAAALLGRTVEEVLGHSREELMPPAAAADHRATDENVMAARHAQLIEEHFPLKTGGERVVLNTKAPWLDTEDRVIGVVAIGKDVTARAAHQQERERLLREVRRTNEELSAFSHVVAHDLRAPVRAIRTYTELLARHIEGQTDDTARHFMSFVTDAAAHMDSLIETLLRYAESGEELALRSVNVNAVIDGLVKMLDPLISETNATITRQPLPDVEADPVRLLQVFQNLIVNAINYRGPIPPLIQITAESFAHEHRFAVSDNGLGIAREHLERVFAPLQRLHGHDTPGTGIGLALCRKIVERHGGRIWVESKVGQGATFYFTLPTTTSAVGDSPQQA